MSVTSVTLRLRYGSLRLRYDEGVPRQIDAMRSPAAPAVACLGVALALCIAAGQQPPEPQQQQQQGVVVRSGAELLRALQSGATDVVLAAHVSLAGPAWNDLVDPVTIWQNTTIRGDLRFRGLEERFADVRMLDLAFVQVGHLHALASTRMHPAYGDA